MTKVVRYRTLSAGPVGVFQPGTVAAVSDEFADDLVAAGFAELVDVPQTAPPPEEVEVTEFGGETETAMVEPPERAVKPKPRRRKAG